MEIVPYICTHEIRGVALHALAAKNIFAKVGVAHKTNISVASVIALPYRVCLNFASHMIQSGSDPDNF